MPLYYPLNTFSKQGGKFFFIFRFLPVPSLMSYYRSTRENILLGASFMSIYRAGGVEAEISINVPELDFLRFFGVLGH